MSLARPLRSQGGPFHNGCRTSYSRNHNMGTRATSTNYNYSNDNLQYNTSFDHSRNHDYAHDFSRHFRETSNFDNYVCPDIEPSSKRRKFSDLSWGNAGIPHQQQNTYYNGLLNHANLFHCMPPKYSNGQDSAPLTFNINSAVTISTRPDISGTYASITSKRNRSEYENNSDDDIVVFASRDEIERCSPSRKDGIDSLQETHLRYSYCAFLQNLGVRLDLPQATIGTAMVLCHRFFFRRSHASHDRFLIATAALFLSAKSEETARPLNDVLKASCELLHKQDFTLLSYLLPIDWFEQYRERIFEAEQLILTTLNFELNVQHPYDPLTSTLEKLGFSQSVLVVLALNLVSEGFWWHSMGGKNSSICLRVHRLACCKPSFIQNLEMLALLTNVTCFLICLFKSTWSWYTAAEMELELDISLYRYNMFSIIWVLFQHSAEESWVFPNSVAALLVGLEARCGFSSNHTRMQLVLRTLLRNF